MNNQPIGEKELHKLFLLRRLKRYGIAFFAMRSHFDRSFTRITSTISRVKELSCKGSWHEALVHFNEAKRAGVEMTEPSVINSIVKASSKLSNKHGKSIHGWVLKQGLDTFSSVGNSILDSYMKCRDLDSAMGIFRSMRSRDSVSWNVIIHGFLDQRDLGRGLWWFRRARVDGFEPTVSTLVLVLQVCRSTWLMNQLFELHGYITKSGFWGSVSVQNSLLGAYTGFDMERAEDMFDEMVERDVISWSVMIAGYMHNEEADLGLQMFVKMVSEANIDPDEVTLVSVLKGCAIIQSLIAGRMAHGFVLGKGLDVDSFVENSLIDMYCKCRDVDSAFRVFSHMTWANLVSWNSIVSGCVLNEKYSEALSVFRSMGKDSIEADEVTLVNVLQACKYYVNLSWCQSVHSLVFRKGYESNDFLHNSLIDAYIKCGRIEIGWDLFNGMDKKDTVSWSTMISGLTYNGQPDEAVAVFNKMIHAQEKPNAITIINLLEACSVSAELKRSKSAHGVAIRTCLAPEVAVGTAIVDMYSKCGTIESARKSFDQISDKNVLSWSAMVAGYGMNGLAREALSLLAEMKLHNIKPNEVTALSVLSACSHGGFVKEGLSFFKSMVDEYDLGQGVEHYSCVVDMLSRAGKFDKAVDLIKEMPEVLESKASVWGALLSASKSFGNKDMGEDVVPRILELEPSNSANYMLASSMYAACGLWSDAARMRRLAKERGIGVIAGYSAVNVNNRSCRFTAGDESHPRARAIRSAVKRLHRCMRIDGSSDLMLIEC